MFFGVTELSPLNHQYAVDWTAKLKDLAIEHHVIHVDCDKKKNGTKRAAYEYRDQTDYMELNKNLRAIT
jgi:hypothetical protein